MPACNQWTLQAIDDVMSRPSILALGLFLYLAPMVAYAQTQTEQLTVPQSQRQTQQPAQPETQQIEQQGAPNEQVVQGKIVRQEKDTIMASSLIGSVVFPANNDGTIGEIEDLIIKMDGTVQGVVIGVGGFLGIGETRVAVEMSTLQMVPRDDGSIRLVLNYTREQLEKAPKFKTAADQKSERALQDLRQRQSPVPPRPLPQFRAQ